MKVFQINSTLNNGSTGRIAEDIGLKVIENGGESYIAYGRSVSYSQSRPIRIGNQWDKAIHLINTRLFDTHGFHSGNATKELVEKIKIIKPDLIHLHNLHGYYLNIEVLFNFLRIANIPTIWTLHDCWPFTGHCCYYERVQCIKWKDECTKCELKGLYPRSIFYDNSKSNYILKRKLFTQLNNLTIVSVSNWLEKQIRDSFFYNFPVQTIYNGIDLTLFRPLDSHALKTKHGFENKQIILGVANVWSAGKGFDTFLELSKHLKQNQLIILVGLSKQQLKKLPSNIIGIGRTGNIDELVEYYNLADVFVNPSIAETFGMVTAEAMACGTPCIVYNSSAMSELITDDVGVIVNEINVEALYEKIEIIHEIGDGNYRSNCRYRAEQLFDKNIQNNKYLSLYKSVS